MKNVEDIYPLSPMQQGMLFHTLCSPGSCMYFEQLRFTLGGELNASLLKRAWQHVIDRHPVLRTAFVWQGLDAPLQIVRQRVTVPWEQQDWRERSPAEQQGQLKSLLQKDRNRGFDLSQAPLMRLTLLQMQNDSYQFIWSFHHLLLDGWSSSLIWKEILACYDAFRQGQSMPLAPSRPYRDFIAWLQQQDLSEAERFWRKELRGFTKPHSIGADLRTANAPGPSKTYDEQQICLTETATAALETFARQHQVTLNTLVQGTWALYLNRRCGGADVVFGTTVAGRPVMLAGVESMVGLFINTLPVRIRVSPEDALLPWLKQLQSKVVEGRQYEYSPLTQIQGWSEVPRGLPLFESIVIFENHPLDISSWEGHGDGVELREVRHFGTRTNYPLTVVVTPGKALLLRVVYDNHHFDTTTITQMLEYLQTLLEDMVIHATQRLSDLSLLHKQTIAVTATFTAEPLEDVLTFWMQQLDMPSKIVFAPYNQVFQQLLDPTSDLSNNHNGVNVILVRFEDLVRYEDESQARALPTIFERLTQDVQDLALALKSVMERSTTPHLVCVCPASPALADPAWHRFFQQMEALLAAELAAYRDVYLITPSELAAIYPVTADYDPQGDELGHIPYTPAFFAALGTLIVRKVHAVKSRPYKVIVLDCDQTLWKGVCGEDGPLGIEIDQPRKALQEFMVAQHEAGMLLCLNSRNNEADVVGVFAHHPEMPLRRNHIVSWRINWRSKSENLLSLADELQLGLDSFVFIDDDPVVCAEVQAHCPDVLTLQLPQEARRIPRFLEHIWAFDHPVTTAEDKSRTTLYRQNLQREQARRQSLSFEDFLTNLGLEVRIADLAPHQLPRVAQLTQRTNQFNTTTIRRSEGEMQQLCQSATCQCLVVEVRDRFGDYGLVGTVIFATGSEAITVDTFLLSCRALGRGVEHRMLARLGAIAKEGGRDWVDVLYIPTSKNQPVLDFLESIGVSFKQPHGAGFLYRFGAELAASLTYNPSCAGPAPAVSESGDMVAPVPGARRPTASVKRRGALLYRIAAELYNAEEILKVVASLNLRRSPDLEAYSVAPRDTLELQLTNIWEKVLGIQPLGVKENFFDAGGHSLLAVSLMARIEKTFGRTLPLSVLFQAPTIEQLASILRREGWSAAWSSLVPIQPEGSKLPFFCVHANRGEVLTFVHLARHLGADQPFYGLQSLGLDGAQAPLTRIEAIATHYIQEIRTIQPEGPYLLGGFCMGGFVAYEMARQLQEQGQDVALLALIDAPRPIPLGSGRNFVYLFRKAVVRRLAYHFQNLRHRTLVEQLTYLAEKGVIAKGKMLSRWPAVTSSGQAQPPQPLPRDRVLEANVEALKRYVPRAYTGKLALFRANEQAYRLYPVYQDPQLGWGKLAVGGLESYTVPGAIPGKHVRMFQEPHVALLAEKLKACLDKAQAGWSKRRM